MSEELTCRYCGKQCKTNFGLTNHLKTCKKKPADSEDPRDQDPRYQERAPKPRPEVSSPPAAVMPSGDAFYISTEHYPVWIHIDFAAALAEHILTNGSQNKAILAFGHQLKKASGDY